MDEVKSILSSKDRSMLIIYADWCGHCQAAEPEWTSLADMVDGKATVYAIESDEYKNDDVSGYPTIKIIKNSKARDYTGNRSAGDMKSALLGNFGGRRTRRFRNRRRKTHRSLR